MFFRQHSHVRFSPPTLPSLSLFPGHAPVLEPLNRSVSFFPREKALFISYLFVCWFFCSCLEKFAVPEEGGGRGGVTGPETGLFRAVLRCALQPTYAHFACSRYLRRENAINIILLFPPFLFSLPFSAHDTLTPPSHSPLTHLFPPFTPLQTGLNSSSIRPLPNRCVGRCVCCTCTYVNTVKV